MTRRLPLCSPMCNSTLALAAVLFLPTPTLAADPHGLLGDWKTHDGSVIRLSPCASGLCLRVVTLSPTAPGNLDQNNPDPNLRKRTVCNLEIGSGFTPEGGDSAGNGHIYDPMSGKTYRATIKLEGDTLHLRGYIGISAFGRTESWQRTTDAKPCT